MPVYRAVATSGHIYHEMNFRFHDGVAVVTDTLNSSRKLMSSSASRCRIHATNAHSRSRVWRGSYPVRISYTPTIRIGTLCARLAHLAFGCK